MQVQVRDGVAGVVAHVEDQPVTPRCDSLGSGHLVRQGEHRAQQAGVPIDEVARIADMPTGNDQCMGWRDRSEIPERDSLSVRGDDVGGDGARRDVAEHAVAHNVGKLLPDDDAARFLADARNAESARARAREHWMRQQAREAATFSGILRGLSERRGPARVTTVDGAEVVGEILGVSAELVLVNTDNRESWVVIRAVVAVSPLGEGYDAGVASDDRGPTSSTTLVGLLGSLAEDRAHVAIRCGGVDVSGRVVGAGTDVVTLRRATGSLTYVPAAALTVVRLA